MQNILNASLKGRVEKLRDSLDIANTFNQTTGEFSPIIRWKVPAGEKFILHDNRNIKVPLFAKLINTSGSEIDINSNLVVAFKEANAKLWEEFASIPYVFYSDHTFAEQQSSDYIDGALLSSEIDLLEVSEDSEIAVLCKADTQVDFTESGTNLVLPVERRKL